MQKSLLIPLLSLILVACSHPLEIVGNGDILSSTGDNNCALEEQPCANLVIGDYLVTYTAQPRSGSEFVRWEGWDACSTSPNCGFDIPGAWVNQYWFQVMPPLRAVFEEDSGGGPSEINSVTGYVKGHSLWQHGGQADYMTGEWLHRFATYAGKTSEWTGRFGQLDQHAAAIPLAFNDQNRAFGYPYGEGTADEPWTSGTWPSADWDHLVTMPWNFAQNSTAYDVRPDPMTHLESVVDYWIANAPTAKRMIFEHWPETGMQPGGASGANLSDANWRAFWGYTRGDYHAWFLDFQDEINTTRPAADIHMIPVGPILADLFLDESYMDGVPSTDYFEDDAPHGLPSLYFLSAMIWYQQIYGVSVDSSYPIPTTTPANIPAAIRNNFPAIIAFIDSRLDYYNANGVRVY